MTSTFNPVPRVVGIGAVFIDDIVLPDGATHMAQLGGGVVHALMGAALWDERPGIVALAGHDLPPAIIHRLNAALDTQGLRYLDIPQIRAWQIFETDGTRRELYRVKVIDPFIQGAQPHHMPPDYHQSEGYYLLQDFDGIQRWCQTLTGLILWEPLQQIMQPGNRSKVRECLQDGAITIISPNLTEAQTVYGTHKPTDLVNIMLDDGAQIAALRMGANGSLVANHNEQRHIPAIRIEPIVDQTGAGNAYCGALLVGLTRGRTLLEAGIMGAVAASFCIKHIGPLDPDKITKAERDDQLHHLMRVINDTA
jgi:sugar/nucleoside kinase (ribokinase family)